jgi:hypothetical protein
VSDAVWPYYSGRARKHLHNMPCRYCRVATIYWVMAERIQVRIQARNGRFPPVPVGYQITFGPEPYHVGLSCLVEGHSLWRIALQHACKGLYKKHYFHSGHHHIDDHPGLRKGSRLYITLCRHILHLMDLTKFSLAMFSASTLYYQLHLDLYFLCLLFSFFPPLFLACLILFDLLYICLLFSGLTLSKLHPCFPGLL